MKNETWIIAEPGRQEIFIIREFEAPRDLIFRAYTEAELFVRWLSPKGYKMTLEQFEPRTGESYHFIHMNKGSIFRFPRYQS